MKRTYKNYFSCLLAFVMVLSLSVSAFAADSTITYKGSNSNIEFAPGSVYTETDLFDNLKNVMPGDTKSETVTIINKYKGCDYINVYMGMLLHDEETTDPEDPNKVIEPTNPISESVFAELEADERRKEKVDAQGKEMSELDYMHEFLAQLNLKVWDGEKTDDNLIYDGHPDVLEKGFEKGNVFLGSLEYKESMDLNVELAVDIKMGNEFADRIGEVDWVFVISERDETETKPKPTKSTEETTNAVRFEGPEYVEEIVDDDGLLVSYLPKTGDETMVIPYVIGGVLALMGLIVLIVRRRKEKEE